MWTIYTYIIHIQIHISDTPIYGRSSIRSDHEFLYLWPILAWNGGLLPGGFGRHRWQVGGYGEDDAGRGGWRPASDGWGMDGFSGDILRWRRFLSKEIDELRLTVDGFRVVFGKKGDNHVDFPAFKPSAGQLAAWNDDLSPKPLGDCKSGTTRDLGWLGGDHWKAAGIQSWAARGRVCKRAKVRLKSARRWMSQPAMFDYQRVYTLW